MFDRILVPLDGSKLAEQVFPYVTELARAFGSEVILIEVCEPEESQYEHTCEIYLSNVAEQVGSNIEEGAGTVKVRAVVLVGRPAEEIVSYAEKNDISLIIMTSHGRSGIMPQCLGSTAYKVLQRVVIPSMVVRVIEPLAESSKDGLFGRILVPLDGSERAEAVLPYVMELMRKLNSEVILLQVVASGKHVHTIGGLDYVYFGDRDADSMKISTQKYLGKVRTRLVGKKDSIRCEVRTGDPVREIVKCANETDSRLIAISSHGHSGIERWAYGSVTYKILQSSNQAVLVARSVIREQKH